MPNSPLLLRRYFHLLRGQIGFAHKDATRDRRDKDRNTEECRQQLADHEPGEDHSPPQHDGRAQSRLGTSHIVIAASRLVLHPQYPDNIAGSVSLKDNRDLVIQPDP